MGTGDAGISTYSARIAIVILKSLVIAADCILNCIETYPIIVDGVVFPAYICSVLVQGYRVVSQPCIICVKFNSLPIFGDSIADYPGIIRVV